MKTLKNQKGIALIVAVGLLLMVSLIGLAAVLTSDTETNIAVNQKNDAKAFYTAEGGLAAAQGDLRTAINGIGGYVIDRDTAISFLDDPMRLLTKYIANFNYRFPQDSFKAAAYMGGRESYRLKYTIVPFDTAVTSRGYTFTYKYIITSQGKYADPVLGFNQKNNIIAGSFSINLDRPSFAQYALFRNLTTSTSGSQLYFAGGEKFNGPVHTNGKPGFSGSSIFNGPFTSSWGSYATSSRINNANPIFNGGSQWGVPTVALPTNNYSQQRAAFGDPDYTDMTAPSSNEIRAGLGLGSGGAVPTGVYVANNGTTNVTGGIYVQGSLDSLKLTRGSNGEQIYRFAQGGSNYTLTVDYANRQTTLNGTTYSGVPNGALFVAGAVNWLGGTSRTTATVAAQTQLTLATTGDILIKNDLIYEGAIFKDSGGVILTDPTLAEAIPDIDPNATVTLGLFSSGGNVKLGTGAPDNINVHATIMASGTNRGFGSQDLSNPHGTVKLLGGIIEYQSQTVGSLDANGNLAGGYSRRYWYDNRYATGFAPPFFPTRPSYLSDLASFNVSRWAAE